jgi:hypothetical protein
VTGEPVIWRFMLGVSPATHSVYRKERKKNYNDYADNIWRRRTKRSCLGDQASWISSHLWYLRKSTAIATINPILNNGAQ